MGCWMFAKFLSSEKSSQMVVKFVEEEGMGDGTAERGAAADPLGPDGSRSSAWVAEKEDDEDDEDEDEDEDAEGAVEEEDPEAVPPLEKNRDG